jgi:ribbon-helix-helix CopG family protein
VSAKATRSPLLARGQTTGRTPVSYGSRSKCFCFTLNSFSLKLYTFAIDPDLAAALKRLKARDGIGESEQIRRALRGWLQKKGVLKAARKRVGSRTRT